MTNDNWVDDRDTVAENVAPEKSTAQGTRRQGDFGVEWEAALGWERWQGWEEYCSSHQAQTPQ